VGPRPLVAVVGQTATGKSAWASRSPSGSAARSSLRLDGRLPRLRHRHRQGPAAERRGVPHHLVDVVGPTEVYTAARYAGDAAAIIEDAWRRGRLPVLVGGSGSTTGR